MASIISSSQSLMYGPFAHLHFPFDGSCFDFSTRVGLPLRSHGHVSCCFIPAFFSRRSKSSLTLGFHFPFIMEGLLADALTSKPISSITEYAAIMALANLTWFSI